ncbi:MAG: cytoplasmic protein, partial [Candidatus Neomarinimicrobiota bacterium]
HTCNDARRSYKNSGIQDMAGDAGAEVRFVRDSHYADAEIPKGTSINRWPIHKEVFRVDKLINMPILKHHSLSGLTIGFKNMMGLIGGNRGRIHRPFSERIVDINRAIIPDLTIVDAIRVLRRNGPSGGSLQDVDELNTLIAGTDRVLVDAWSARIFGTDPNTLEYLTLAHAAGMGNIDTNKFPAKHFDFKS